jgi:putative aldouronate transport system permease protein
MLFNNVCKDRSINKTFMQTKKYWQVYLLLLPSIAYFVIFHYIPMYGVQLAFKDYSAVSGIWGSKWVGLNHFVRFFNSHYFWDLIRNTVGISFYQMSVGFPSAVIFALMLNEITSKTYKKIVQTVSFAPHFFSVVVISGAIIAFLNPNTGIINNIIKALAGEPIRFIENPAWFKTIYVLSGVWQNTGWNSIIYISVLSTIDPQMHEAAIIDGASKFRRIIHINIPSLMPIMTIMLILRFGSIMSVGFEKVFLLQNHLNLEASEIIATYVYKAGLINAQYGFSTAIGLFNSIINLILLVMVNKIAQKLGNVSLY